MWLTQINKCLMAFRRDLFIWAAGKPLFPRIEHYGHPVKHVMEIIWGNHRAELANWCDQTLIFRPFPQLWAVFTPPTPGLCWSDGLCGGVGGVGGGCQSCDEGLLLQITVLIFALKINQFWCSEFDCAKCLWLRWTEAWRFLRGFRQDFLQPQPDPRPRPDRNI